MDTFNKEKAQRILKQTRQVITEIGTVPWTCDDVKKEIDRGGKTADNLLLLVLLASDLHDALNECLDVPRMKYVCSDCLEESERPE